MKKHKENFGLDMKILIKINKISKMTSQVLKKIDLLISSFNRLNKHIILIRATLCFNRTPNRLKWLDGIFLPLEL